MTEISTNDTCTSQEEEDSDDNFLHLPPAALLKESVLRSKNHQTSQSTVEESSECECSQPPLASVNKLKYSLAQLVQRSKTQDKEDQGLSNLQELLRHDIDQGGITKLIEEEEEEEEHGDMREQKLHLLSTQQNKNKTCGSETIANAILLPEHEKTLLQYALENERIAPLHPGEDIFCNDNIGKLFSFPGRLSLSDYGFIANKADAMDNLLMTSNTCTEELEELIISRTIEDMYLVKQCPNSVMRWLLQLMSIHEGMIIAGTIFDMMWSTMNLLPQLHPTVQPWIPTFKDIAAVFINYGANMDTLLPPSIFHGTHFSMDDFRCSQQTSQQPYTRPICLPVSNLVQVINILTQCLVIAHNRRTPLDTGELKSLAYLVGKVSLDKQLTGCAVQVDFEQCLAAILNCFDEDTWQSEASLICRMLTHCSDHHHNLVYLVRLMPANTHRGRVVRRMLSFAILLDLTSDSREQHHSRDSGEPKVSDLLPLLAEFKPNCRSHIDYYQRLHSLITLVDLAVGSNIYLLKSSDKEALASLVIKLRDMAGDIRESHKHLCRTQVKDMMIQTASKLTYFEQNLTSKQTFLQTILKYDQSLIEDHKKSTVDESDNQDKKDYHLEDSVRTER